MAKKQDSGGFKQSGPDAWEKTVNRPGAKGHAKSAPMNASAKKMIEKSIGGPKSKPGYKQGGTRG